MNFTFQKQTFSISRYPSTENKSLQAWNAADELILNYLDSTNLKSKTIAIFGDRFGFLSCFLNEFQPYTVIDYKSQEKALKLNVTANNLSVFEDRLLNPLSPLPDSTDIVLIKIPKSMDLFRLYLQNISKSLSADSVIICGFMTKYFSPQMLIIAEEFFEEVEQSKAKKKSRILILKKPKSPKEVSILNSIPLDDSDPNTKKVQQYFGVFSANNIDYATQFLIENLWVKEHEHTVLDLACGNGILAYTVQYQSINREIHVLDDSFLAIESAKLNLDGNIHFHYNDSLEDFEDAFFDLIVSNPPFHFEFETNIEVSINLFNQVKRCLKSEGRFVCVASQHLNYKTHLEKIFTAVKIVAENKKFVVYECV